MATGPGPRPGTRVTMPHCPVCAAELQLGSSGALDRWSCPEGHGLAMTLSESYERLQEDEIERLWQMAREATPGPLRSPFDQAPMKRFALPYDDDEASEGAEGDAPDVGTVEIDVDVANQFIWFDAGELDRLPTDLPDAEPTEEEQAKELEIASQFGAGIESAMRERDAGELSERLYRRIARNPAALSTLDRLGRTLTAY